MRLRHCIHWGECLCWAVIITLAGCQTYADAAAASLFARSNLVAWCIVPFDAKKRGPEERAAMMEKLGFKLFAYDYRAEHVPTFEAEMDALKRHNIQLLAWWFPGALNDEARMILEVLRRHQVRAQLWISGGGGADAEGGPSLAQVKAEAQRLRPIAEAAAKIGCTIALYNHGGWGGEPENQVAVIEALRTQNLTNVGIVYNLHHGHGHLDRFTALMQLMKPYLVALNLNGMVRNGDEKGKKILPLGQGDLDLSLLRIIRDSGWQGPIGILNHTDEDAEARLRDNLDGLDWLVKQLDGQPAGPKPQPRSWREPPPSAVAVAGAHVESSLSPDFGKALVGGLVVEGKPDYRQLPITVECRAKLNSKRGFNILVASDTKASAAHWELYSYSGSGEFSVYQPGRGGEFKSGVDICDGQWHYLTAILESDQVSLYVDGKLAKQLPAKGQTGSVIPGGLAFGQLVEGGIGCDGLVDEVRLSRKARPITNTPATPFTKDAATMDLWNFDDLTAVTAAAKDYWAIEDPKEREKLPLYQTIPAATADELTPANGFPQRATYTTWHRSHGDNGGTRYSALDQINRQNVTNLQMAWIYHAKDGNGNIQCNPIIVRGVMYAPIPSKQIVAVNAANGQELWRFKPEGRPAFRGLIFWPGGNGASERILFCAGQFLHALNPKTGQPIADFGAGGKTLLPGVAQGDFGAATAGPTIFQRILVVSGFEKDAWGFDVVTGKHLWTFHTVPHPGEFGYDTWDRPESYAANCWGGMAMDEVRGIAYLTTGGPKPNFIGVSHRGQNLFANCVIALDARTGKRLWHFQEIRHDLWDLDIPAPPNLATISRDGKKVDVLAVPTKIGNTLLLDRVSGKPIFPFRLRRAPTSDLRGEVTFPYQPDPELPERFSKMEFTKADLTDLSEEATEYATSQFASATTGFFRPCTEGRANLFLGIDGGAEWTGAAVDPETGRFYVTANHVGWVISLFRDEDPPYNPNEPKTRGQLVFEQSCAQCHATNKMGLGTAPPLRGLRFRLDDAAITNQVRTGKNAMPAHPDISEDDLKALVDYLLLRDRPLRRETSKPDRPRYNTTGYPKFYDKQNYPLNKPPWGTLNCLDLNTGKLLWKVPLGEYPELTKQGYPITGTENYGGAIVTAGGLVFCAGTRDHKIRAFDKDTGAELWAMKLPWVGSAPPACYEVNGRQYIVIASTGGNKLGTPYGDAYIAFALPESNPVCFIGHDRFDGYSRSTNNGWVTLESPWMTPSNVWNELVVSWNAATSADGQLKIETRAARGETMTPWYNLGFWAPDPAKHQRESVHGQKDQFAEVKTDILACRERMERAQVRISMAGDLNLPALKFLGLCFTDSTAPPPTQPPNRAAWGKVIEVPRRSQLGWPEADGWCSPTSVSMLLAHWAQVLKRPEMDLPVPVVAKAVNDPNWSGTGNWPFNTAFAGSFSGMRAFVTRFADVRELEDWIVAGVPVAVSVSFDLFNGKPKDEGNGHLVVVVGFTETGDVVVNDPWPNPKKENSVRKVYPRENLIRAWKRSRNAVYLIYPEGHRLPENQWGHW